MKKFMLFTVIIALLFAFSGCEKNLIDQPIDEMVLKSGKPDKATGFDEWGYNWNAHHFNGILFNAIVGDNLYNDEFFGNWEPYTGNDEAYLESYPLAVYLPWRYRYVQLVMHWNESLISKEGVYPFPLKENWIDSDAWITFHYSGIDENGKRWAQFQKMKASKFSDYYKAGNWYNEFHEKIGVYNNWPQLIMIQVVNTGIVPEEFFAPYKSPFGGGLGK